MLNGSPSEPARGKNIRQGKDHIGRLTLAPFAWFDPGQNNRRWERFCFRAAFYRPWNPTMLTALVLICSATVTPDISDCTRDNAADVMRVPVSFSNPVSCFMYGRAYLTEGAIRRPLGSDDRVKVICAPTETVGDSIPTLPAE
jgi:hypothetical protein